MINCIPMICSDMDFTSSKLLANLTPPPLPLPPAWICALITCHEVPVSAVSFWAAKTASSELLATIPFCTATPKLAKISLP